MGRRAEIQRFRHRCSLRTGTSSVQATEAQRECPSSVFFFFFGGAFRRTFAHRPLSLSPRNPLRVIAHIDIDAAYAAMEMARLKIPADQPMAVQQWNGLVSPGQSLASCRLWAHKDQPRGTFPEPVVC